jgi:two-component system sensor histidine kinase DesK
VSTSPAPRSGWRVTRWANLIYLANLLWKPFIYPAPYGLDWLLIALVVGLFIFLYARSTSGRYDTRRWFTIPVTLLGLVTTPINSGAAVLFVYAAAAAGGSETRRNALRWMLALTVLSVVAIVAADIPLPWLLFALIPPTLFIWIVGSLQLETAAGLREAAELRVANVRIEHLATVAERERIARDLHDLLGHSLSVIALKSELAGKLVARDAARAGAELEDIQAVTREALAEVRGAVQGYRRLALADALEGAQAALLAAGIDCELSEPDRPLPAEVDAVLAWAVREGTTNVIRHSAAHHCAIRVRAERDRAALEIEDDGRAAPSNVRRGSGLDGLRERARRVRGELEAGARAEGGGFLLRLTVPLVGP